MRARQLLHSCFLLCTLVAAEVAGQSSRSPFLPPAGSDVAAPTEDAPLQFCGYIGAGDAARYCIHDPAKRRSVWLRVGEEGGGVHVEGFDAETRTVSVLQSGRPMTLKLQSPTPAGGGNAATAGPLPVAGQMAPANSALVNTVVANPTPADEAKLLEAVAAEVRRRRALRQAAQQQQQHQQPSGAANSR
jgi:hypothetical protein